MKIQNIEYTKADLRARLAALQPGEALYLNYRLELVTARMAPAGADCLAERENDADAEWSERQQDEFCPAWEKLQDRLAPVLTICGNDEVIGQYLDLDPDDPDSSSYCNQWYSAVEAWARAQGAEVKGGLQFRDWNGGKYYWDAVGLVHGQNLTREFLVAAMDAGRAVRA